MSHFYFECRECGYDSNEARKLAESDEPAICPLCAGDTGRDGDMRFRPASYIEVLRLVNKL